MTTKNYVLICHSALFSATLTGLSWHSSHKWRKVNNTSENSRNSEIMQCHSQCYSTKLQRTCVLVSSQRWFCCCSEDKWWPDNDVLLTIKAGVMTALNIHTASSWGWVIQIQSSSVSLLMMRTSQFISNALYRRQSLNLLVLYSTGGEKILSCVLIWAKH